MSSQEYLWDRGGQGDDIPTDFMMSYLGVASGVSDVDHITVTGAGSVFGDWGIFTLSYPFINDSDIIIPDGSAETAFEGDAGSAAVNKRTEQYRTIFLGFPFEAFPDVGHQEEFMRRALGFCAQLIFSDGFETGDTSRWSSTVP